MGGSRGSLTVAHAGVAGPPWIGGFGGPCLIPSYSMCGSGVQGRGQSCQAQPVSQEGAEWCCRPEGETLRLAPVLGQEVNRDTVHPVGWARSSLGGRGRHWAWCRVSQWHCSPHPVAVPRSPGVPDTPVPAPWGPEVLLRRLVSAGGRAAHAGGRGKGMATEWQQV